MKSLSLSFKRYKLGFGEVFVEESDKKYIKIILQQINKAIGDHTLKINLYFDRTISSSNIIAFLNLESESTVMDIWIMGLNIVDVMDKLYSKVKSNINDRYGRSQDKKATIFTKDPMTSGVKTLTK